VTAVTQNDDQEQETAGLSPCLQGDQAQASGATSLPVKANSDRASNKVAAPSGASPLSPPLYPAGTVPLTVGSAVLGYFKKTRGRPKPSFAGLRLDAIRKLIQARHGGPVDTDDGEPYLLAALPHLVALAEARGRSVDAQFWCEELAPRVAAERDSTWFGQLECEFTICRRRLTADGIADLLRVTTEEVRRYKLQTFGAIDRRKAQRKAERKAANRAYQKQKRAINGAIPREQSRARTKPWAACGISRAKWYRSGRETISSAAVNTQLTGRPDSASEGERDLTELGSKKLQPSRGYLDKHNCDPWPVGEIKCIRSASAAPKSPRAPTRRMPYPLRRVGMRSSCRSRSHASCKPRAAA
jgi:hypothetical protein